MSDVRHTCRRGGIWFRVVCHPVRQCFRVVGKQLDQRRTEVMPFHARQAQRSLAALSTQHPAWSTCCRPHTASGRGGRSAIGIPYPSNSHSQHFAFPRLASQSPEQRSHRRGRRSLQPSARSCPTAPPAVGRIGGWSVRNYCTHHGLPAWGAQHRTLVCKLTSAPASTSTRTTLWCPRAAATVSGV